MVPFETYRDYPELVTEIIDYFKFEGSLRGKTVIDFCMKTGLPTEGGKGNQFRVQPHLVNMICETLCEYGHMSQTKNDTQLGLYNSYVTFPKQLNPSPDVQNQLNLYYNSLVYGFEFIYSIYKEIVLPVVYTHSDGKCEIGTAFKINGGIATAKHCLEGAKSIAIRGFPGETLNQSTIYISDNPDLDVAYIETPYCTFPYASLDEAKVTEEILVMGFPRVAGFIDFLTAEPAMVSSIGQRLTPTKGTVSAFGVSIFEKCELMLITAKIKGGNSGGPIINRAGSVVGIACHLPAYEGEYDDVGYGIAVPATALLDIIERKPRKLCVPTDYFVDFAEE